LYADIQKKIIKTKPADMTVTEYTNALLAFAFKKAESELSDS